MSSRRRWGALAVAALLAPAAGCLRSLVPAPVADDVIEARVRAELKGHTELNVQFLDIDAHVGTVTLSGIVGSEEERDSVVRLIRRIQGVRDVVANILVRP